MVDVLVKVDEVEGFVGILIGFSGVLGKMVEELEKPSKKINLFVYLKMMIIKILSTFKKTIRVA